MAKINKKIKRKIRNRKKLKDVNINKLRISVSKSLKKSLEIGETKSIQNNFNYVLEGENGIKNVSFFILTHKDFDIIEQEN